MVYINLFGRVSPGHAPGRHPDNQSGGGRVSLNGRGWSLRIPGGARPAGERAPSGPRRLPAGAPPASRVRTRTRGSVAAAETRRSCSRGRARPPPRQTTRVGPEAPGQRAELRDPGITRSAPRPGSCAPAPPAISVSHSAPRPTPSLRRTARPKEPRAEGGASR